MPLDFDYNAARKAGYSDDQLLDALDKEGKLDFDLSAARKAGHGGSAIMRAFIAEQGPAPAAAEPESSSLLRRAGDYGITAVKALIGAPETLVGLANIPTGGAAGRAAESLGVKFRESKELLSDLYSPEQKAANQRVAEAEGFVDTAGAMLSNPSTIAHTAVESIPQMGLGGAVGRGVLAVAPKLGALGAAAVGEGAVGAGTAAEQIRQQSGGDLSIGQAGAALASGVGTGVFGLVGGRLAQKFGVADIDTALVQAGAPAGSTKGVVRRMLEGGVSEGVFEELPQSIQEQMWQNAAMDRPLLEGVPESAAQGLIVGGLFGGVAGGALHGKVAQPDQPPAADPVTGAPLQLGYKPDPFISFPDGSVGRQSEVDAFINSKPESERNAYRARLYGYAPQDAAPTVTTDDVLATVGNPEVGVDDAIATAQQALASDTPEMKAARDAQIDAAWSAHLRERAAAVQADYAAAEQQRRDADVPAMESQLADQTVEQAEILTRAQGFDEQAPTAMQVAMQQAQAKRQAAIEGAAARRAAAATEPAAAAQSSAAAVDIPASAAISLSDAESQNAPQNIPKNIPGPAPSAAAPGAKGDNLARAKQILTAAGVTGNERMAALRAIRTGENTLDDLIDAHPPKEITNATPTTDAPAVPGRYPAGDPAPAPVQPDPAPGREAVPQPADMGSGDAAAAGIPGASDVRDGDGAAAAAPGELTGRAAQRQATIDDLAGRSTKELRALAKSDKRAYVRTAVADVLAQRDGETRAKRSDAAKRALVKAKQIDPDNDTMAEAIARMGGIKRDSAQGRMRFAPEEVKARAGIRPLFPVNGGMRIEDMAAALAELGYVQRDENGKYDQADFEDKLAEVAGGADVRTPQGMMLRAQQEYEAAQQQAFAESPAEYEQIEYYADQADDELQRMVDAAFDAPPTNKEMTDEEIDAAFGIAPAASRAIPEVDPAAPARESDPRDQAPTGDDFDLTAESADEARARVTADEQRQQQAARDERAAAERERQDRDRRDIAARQDASAENFQLGQSAEDSLAGQDALFSTAPNNDYRDEHTAPSREDAAPLSDLTGDGNIYPDDVYSAKGLQYYGTGVAYDREAFRIANQVRGKPDAMVTIYRSVPSDIDAEINPGDWVAITKQYAIDHGESRFDGDYKILTMKVRAGDIFTNGDSIQEWGYDPEDGSRASTSPAAGRGMPAAEVTKAIAPLRAKWAGFTRVNVVQSASDLPAEIAGRVMVDEGSEGFYDPRTHAVYLIADNLADAARSVHVAVHETVGHAGLRMLNDKTVTQAVQQAGANRFVRDLAAAIQKDRGGDLAQHVALEEALAEISAATETGDFDGLVQRYGVTVPDSARPGVRGVVARVIAAVRQFMAAITRQPVESFSDADVRDLIAQQRAAVEGREQKLASLNPLDDGVKASERRRSIEINGVRRPIENSKGQVIVQDFNKQMAFYRWFGDSAVVDDKGRPLVVYHGTIEDFDSFDMERAGAVGEMFGKASFFTSSPVIASGYSQRLALDPVHEALWGAEERRRSEYSQAVLAQFRETKTTAGPISDPVKADYDRVVEARRDRRKQVFTNEVVTPGANVVPAYLAIQNPYEVDAQGANYHTVMAAAFEGAQAAGADGIIVRNVVDSANEYAREVSDVFVTFSPNQIKSATGNAGTFNPEDADIRASRAPAQSGGNWESPEMTKFDDVIHAMQDKQVDLKRVVAAIRDSGKTIDDNFDPYLQEELFYGRSAKGVKDFLDGELRPMVEEMRAHNVAMSDFEEYLWNRHAEERNEQIAKINEDMPDGGSGIKTKDARAYLAALPAEKRKAYVSLAKHIDAINAKTREMLVSSGLEKKSTVEAWTGAYESYVPLQREDVDTGGNGTGQGFSIRGNSTKRAVGSNKPVADIIANIAMQREKTIVRAEKNRVAQALLGLAKQNPNKEFWDVDNAPTERVVMRVGGMDKVVERIVPGFKSQDNVVLARVDGDDHFITFNERDMRAVRMARSIKNLDADQLGRVLSSVAKATRYLAAINTQYNPIFGIVNLIRDSQGALLNLSTTKIAGDQAKVLKYTVHAMRGIYADLRAKRAGKPANSAWAVIFDEFQNEGGQTGFRDQFANAEARGEAIAKEIEATDRNIAFKVGGAMFDWLSDYNDVMENAVRLAAYRAAKEKGLSKQQSASLAKNLTVNFNRKGQVATQVGALYAFFNASTQGTARLAETLTGPMGKKIIYGGILLGTMQALLLAGSDLDDEEPPEFVRSRSLIFPIGDKQYLTLPMPLGFHVLPNLGRIPMEFMLNGFREPTHRVADLIGLFADTFNPIGNAGISLQTITPSLVDPLAALAENRDFTGKQIARGDLNSLAPTPGYTRANNTATTWSKAIAYGLNILSGGTDYKPGLVSPTPDQLDYLIGQATGGVGRELSKFNQVVTSAITGEDLPVYKMPLVGRFLGNASGQAAESGKFYSAIKRINQHEAEIKGLREERRTEDVIEYMRNNREARLVQLANRTESEIRKLKQAKRQAVDAGQRDRVKAIELRISAYMANFNQRVALAREQSDS